MTAPLARTCQAEYRRNGNGKKASQDFDQFSKPRDDAARCRVELQRQMGLQLSGRHTPGRKTNERVEYPDIQKLAPGRPHADLEEALEIGASADDEAI